MKSIRSKKFRKLHNSLPKEVRDQAKEAYNLFKKDPYHNSLHFKCVNLKDSVYSVRIGDNYRALGIRDKNDVVVWFWIGTHEEYNHLV